VTYYPTLTTEEVEFLYDLVPAAESYVNQSGLTPGELLSAALAEFVENHPDPQDL
jgi:hypothetical protein